MTALPIPDTFIENIPCDAKLPVGRSELHGIPVLRMWEDIPIMAVLAEPMMLWIFKQCEIEELIIDFEIGYQVNDGISKGGYVLDFKDPTMAMVFKLAWL